MIGLFQKIRGKKSVTYTQWQLDHLQTIKNLAIDYTFDKETFNDYRFHELIEYLWGNPADSVEKIDWNKTIKDYPRITYLNEVTKINGVCNIDHFRFMHMGYSIGYRNRIHPKEILDPLDEMNNGKLNYWHQAKYGMMDEKYYWLFFNYDEERNRLYPHFAFETNDMSPARQFLVDGYIEKSSNGNSITITDSYKDVNNRYSVTDYRMAGELIFILGLYLICNPEEFNRAIKLSKKFGRIIKNDLIINK